MAPRLTTCKRVDIILFHGKYDNISYVCKEFKRKYNKPAPARNTVLELKKRFKQSGSLADNVRSGKLMCDFDSVCDSKFSPA